jgi:hypothetical protein
VAASGVTEIVEERYTIGQIDGGDEEKEAIQLEVKQVKNLLELIPYLEKTPKMDDGASFELVSPPSRYFYV